MWWRRLAWELGVLEPVDVAAPTLDPDATKTVERVFDGFLLLVGLRRTDGPVEPVAFSVRFAAAWCGTPKNATHRAIQELSKTGHLLVDSHAGRLPLYLPGTPVRRGAELTAQSPDHISGGPK